MKKNDAGAEEECKCKGAKLKFDKSLYSRISLIKAAYNFTDIAYLHLDSDDKYYYVSIEPKRECQLVTENEFINEMLTQTVRHEVYQQTKSIRELMLARSLATSVIMRDDIEFVEDETAEQELDENSILKDWYAKND